MSLIERSQRSVLFEEAARLALTRSQIDNVSDFYAELVGYNDYLPDTKPRYGFPMAPLYKPQTGSVIDVPKIRKYFEVLGRDLEVTDSAVTELENKLAQMSLEVWARMAILKNRSSDIEKTTSLEKERAAIQATWSFAETFSNVFYINMNTTTAWIDTAEGSATLPLLEKEQNIKSSELILSDFSTSDLGGFLSSTPDMMIDGLDTTNWRTFFTSPETQTYVVYDLKTPVDIIGVFINPVGFGINTTLEIDSGNGFITIFKKIIYKKETIPFESLGARRIKLTYTTSESVLPKVAGIKNLVFYKGTSIKSAKIFSSALVPSFEFNEVRIDWKAKSIPNTSVNFYFSTDNSTWTPVSNGVWFSDNPTTKSSVNIDLQDLTEEGILYVSSSLGDIALSNSDGELSVGENQFEISAIRYLSLQEGEYPHDPNLDDFSDKKYNKCWCGTNTTVQAASGAASPVQLRLAANIIHPQLKKGKFLFGGQSVNSEFPGITFLPLSGGLVNSSFQTNYTYRFKCHLFADEDAFVTEGLFWFLQGFRDAGKKTFAEVGKSYGAFSIFVNGVKVAGETQPWTLFSNNTYSENSVNTGKNFSFSLEKGWNTFEILIYTVSPLEIEEDKFSSEEPYLQITISPNPLDKKFRNKHGISRVSGSGLFKPIQEFDLMWNTSKDPTNWAWSNLGSRDRIVFNLKDIKSLDGYYGVGDQTKVSPNCLLTYRGYESIGGNNGLNVNNKSVYIRADIERESGTKSFPVLEEYKVMVR
jgi:hypothetical protein